MGARAYTIIEQYKTHLEGSVIEIGSDRGEGSTRYLFEFCKRNHLNFYTIDIDEAVHEGVLSFCDTAFRMSGQYFLDYLFPDFNEKICFAYLDNFDYIFKSIEGKDWVNKQIEHYKSKNLTMNNYNSKRHHLEQAKRLISHAADTCFVLFDDTWELKHPRTDDRCYDGKGGFAIPYLLSCGFRVFSKSKNEVPHKSYVLMGRLA